MILRETALAGVFVVDVERHDDNRGFFARAWSAADLAMHGLESGLVQSGISFNRRRGTLRGLHYQLAPHGETKLVRCTRGAALDVALDIRAGSPTFGQHVTVELTEDNHRALYIPAGLAQGFQTLVDDTELLYAMTGAHAPDAARGIRYDDPAFAIAWPIADPIMLERDRTYLDWVPGQA